MGHEITDNVIRIVLPVALKDVFDILSPDFCRTSGCVFEVALMLNPEVPTHIDGGADWSIAFSNPEYIDQIACVRSGQSLQRDLGYTPLTFATRGQAAEPPVASRDAVAAFLRSAKSIAITKEGTSGAMFARLLDELGIAQTLLADIQRLPGGGPMLALQQGSVEVAALPHTNIAAIPGVVTRAICPPDWNVHVDLAYCLNPAANDATRAFATWLDHPDRTSDLKRLGLVPR